MALVFFGLLVLQHARNLALCMRVHRFDPLSKIILGHKVIFMDLLKEFLQ